MRCALFIATLLAFAVPAGAQTGQRVWGSLFVGSGIYLDEYTYDLDRPVPGRPPVYEVRERTVASRQFGVAITRRVVGGLGVTGEGGLFVADGHPWGAGSLNLSYRFRDITAGRVGWTPVVAGGYTRVGTSNGSNVMAGIQYVSRSGVGLGVDVRATRLTEPAEHDFIPHPLLVDVRLGVIFRP